MAADPAQILGQTIARPGDQGSTTHGDDMSHDYYSHPAYDDDRYLAMKEAYEREEASNRIRGENIEHLMRNPVLENAPLDALVREVARHVDDGVELLIGGGMQVAVFFSSCRYIPASDFSDISDLMGAAAVLRAAQDRRPARPPRAP